jgi:branched-chain amino acid transport system ATP-binding protein
MLASARALVQKLKLLMLDEPSPGLAPSLVTAPFKKIAEINRETSVTVLIAEEKVRRVLELCDRVYHLKPGRVAVSLQRKWAS